MRAVVYTRVSSDDSGCGKSVAEQERECREVCEREGWTVAEVLCDNDIGASRYSSGTRSAYARLSEVLRPGDVLVTWEASRAHRDLQAYLELRNLCAERSVRWCYSGRVHDLNDGSDRFLTGLDALLSEQEAERTRDRVLRASRSRAAEGKPHGKMPFGYRRVINMTTGATDGWVPDEVQAPIVREIFTRFLSGDAVRFIVRDLNDRGAVAGSAGQPWTPTRIRNALRCATYAGLRTHRGQIVGAGLWDPLVSEDDYLSTVATLSDPSRSTYRGHEPKHLLTGIAVCGVCREGVRHLGAKPGRNATYQCPQLHIRRRADMTDELVTEIVLGRLDDAEFRRALAAGPDGPKLVDEAQALRVRLQGFVDQAVAGNLTPASLAQIEAKLIPEIEAAERAVRPTVPALADLLSAGDVREEWARLGVIPRRETVKTLMVPVILPGATRIFDPTLIGIEWKA